MAGSEVLGEVWAVAAPGGSGPVDVRIFVRGVTNYRYSIDQVPKQILAEGIPMSSLIVQNLGAIPIELGNDRGLQYGQGMRIAPNSILSGGAITPGGPGAAVVENYAKANLPAPANPGRLAKLIDNDRSVWIESSVPDQWWSVNGNVYNVMAFGATGLGIADDLAAIQAAIDAATAAGGGTVWFPSGTYRTTGSIIIKVNVDLVGASMAATVIAPSAQTYPAITNAASLHWFRIANLKVDYVNANGAATCTNPLAAGIAFLTAPNICGDFVIENVWVNLAYYGFNDTATSYMATWRNFYITNCNTGFVKSGNGTTLVLENVFVAFGVLGFQFNAQQSVTMTGCAMQSLTGLNPFLAISCHGFKIQGFDYEACTIQANGSLFTFSGCSGFSGSGIVGNGNTMVGANTSVLNLNTMSNDGVFLGCRFGPSETATGAGGDANALSTNGVRVTFIGCVVQAPVSGAGAPTVRLGSIANTAGDAILFLNCDTAGAAFDPGNIITTFSGATWTWTTPAAPTINQNGARTFTTTYFRASVVGKTCIVQASWVITNAGAAGFGIFIGGWPAAIAPRNVGANAIIGSFFYNRAGTFYEGLVEANTAVAFNLYRGGNADTAALGGAGGGNFATANGDVLSLVLSYELA